MWGEIILHYSKKQNQGDIPDIVNLWSFEK